MKSEYKIGDKVSYFCQKKNSTLVTGEFHAGWVSRLMTKRVEITTLDGATKNVDPENLEKGWTRAKDAPRAQPPEDTF